jgi:hypothetical protein
VSESTAVISLARVSAADLGQGSIAEVGQIEADSLVALTRFSTPVAVRAWPSVSRRWSQLVDRSSSHRRTHQIKACHSIGRHIGVEE